MLSLVYLLIGIFWLVKSVMYWRDILMIQVLSSLYVLYITALDWRRDFGASFRLCVPVWLFRQLEQKRRAMYVLKYAIDLMCVALTLLGIASLLNALRNTLSIFVLLIVSMGYGVVKACSNELTLIM